MRALGLERRVQPVARADQRVARERQQPATAEAAVRLAREIEALGRPQLGREHAEAVLRRGHELLELAAPGGAVAGGVALELGDVVLERRRQEGRAAVREQRRGRQVGVEVLEPVAAQVVAELRVGGGAGEERVPRRHQLVREAGRGEVVARADGPAEHVVALEHAHVPAPAREQCRARQGVDAGTNEDRVEARHGGEHTSLRRPRSRAGASAGASRRASPPPRRRAPARSSGRNRPRDRRRPSRAPRAARRARRAKPTSMTGSARPCAMKTARRPRQIGLPALDLGHEAGEGEDAGRRRAVRAEAERVAHHRAHREAAEHGLLRRQPGRSHSSSWNSASWR